MLAAMDGTGLDKRRPGLLAVVAVTMLLSACAGQAPEPSSAARAVMPTARDARTANEPTAGNTIARLAVRMIGVPYLYGGADPDDGFDCSGLVYYTYTTSGYAVPRTSQDLFKAAHKIALDDAIEGDLVFFQDQAKLSHVGIYLGEGMFVHAPSSGDSVAIASLDTPYYQRHLVAVGRLLPAGRL
jgi:cell wall-associated NlpC family hydrolase